MYYKIKGLTFQEITMLVIKENIYNNIFYKLGLLQFKGTSVYKIKKRKRQF